MSFLFEAQWREGYENFERVYDKSSGKSLKRKIDKMAEYFVPMATGNYTYSLDKSIKLDKRYGTWKQGSEEFGFSDQISHHIRDEYWDVDANKAKYNKEIGIFFIDIETRTGQNSEGFPVPELALEEISMFQILCTRTNTMYLLGVKDWKHQERYLKYGDNARYSDVNELAEPLPFDVKYLNCQNEDKLIDTFLALYKHLDPLLLLAWNGSGFDYPYIYNRMKRLGKDVNLLSNYGKCHYKESEFQGRKEFDVRVDGHFWLDMLDVYKKFDFQNHQNYQLDTIAYNELKDRKVNHDEYSAFDDFYTGKYNIPDNPTEDQKRMLVYQEAVKGNTEEVKELSHSEFVWYGLKDTWLLKRLDDKRKLVDTMLLISQMSGTQINDTLGTVKVWGSYLSNLLMLDNMVLPKREDHQRPQITGGFVREPKRGKHGWTMSVDINSMYPLLSMVSFNMSPETFVEPHNIPVELRELLNKYYNTQDEEKIINLDPSIKSEVTRLLHKHNLSLGINGQVFNRSEEGIIPRTVRDIYNTRKGTQRKLRAEQQLRIDIREELNKRKGK